MGMERKKCSSKRSFLNEKKLFNCISSLVKDNMYVSYQRLTGSILKEIVGKGLGVWKQAL